MKKMILIVTVLLLFGLIGYRLTTKLSNDAAVEARSKVVTLPTVTTSLVERRVLSSRVLITGNIRPESEVDIFARVGGPITQVMVEIGDEVKKGQTLAVIESDIYRLQVQQAQAALQMAEAGLSSTQRGADSAESLAKTQNISDVSLTQARSGLAASRAQVAQARAALAMARENLSNSQITSPIDGVVTRRLAQLGMMVAPAAMNPAAALFQVQDRSRLKIDATIDEKELAFVQPGMAVQVQVDAWPGEIFQGTVKLVSLTLDPISHRAQVEVTLQDDGAKLLANMFARGTLVQSTEAEGLAIPESALVKGVSKPSVYVLSGDKVNLKEVSLGVSDGGYVAVVAGLNEGETIIPAGHSRLGDGMQVEVQTSAGK